MVKLIPMVVMATGVAGNADKIRGILDNVTSVAVQSEVNEITKLLILDQVSGEQLPTQDQFAAYLRKNMRVAENSKNTRDLSLDQFGTPYRIEYLKGAVKVTSAAKDKSFGTEDDIYSQRQFD